MNARLKAMNASKGSFYSHKKCIVNLKFNTEFYVQHSVKYEYVR